MGVAPREKVATAAGLPQVAGSLPSSGSISVDLGNGKGSPPVTCSCCFDWKKPRLQENDVRFGGEKWVA